MGNVWCLNDGKIPGCDMVYSAGPAGAVRGAGEYGELGLCHQHERSRPSTQAELYHVTSARNWSVKGFF